MMYQKPTRQCGHGRRALKFLGVLLAMSFTVFWSPGTDAFELDELTIADLQEGMHAGTFTSRSITEAYLDIVLSKSTKKAPPSDPIWKMNPDALFIADQRDKERACRDVFAVLCMGFLF